MAKATIYENEHIYIVEEAATIPWVKIFSQVPHKELTDCEPQTRAMLWSASLIVERCLLDYYQPDKVNMASFGNMLPRVHIHLMARFADDSHYPEPMWGRQQRDSQLDLPPFSGFVSQLQQALNVEFG